MQPSLIVGCLLLEFNALIAYRGRKLMFLSYVLASLLIQKLPYSVDKDGGGSLETGEGDQ